MDLANDLTSAANAAPKVDLSSMLGTAPGSPEEAKPNLSILPGGTGTVSQAKVDLGQTIPKADALEGIDPRDDFDPHMVDFAKNWGAGSEKNVTFEQYMDGLQNALSKGQSYDDYNAQVVSQGAQQRSADLAGAGATTDAQGNIVIPGQPPTNPLYDRADNMFSQSADLTNQALGNHDFSDTIKQIQGLIGQQPAIPQYQYQAPTGGEAILSALAAITNPYHAGDAISAPFNAHKELSQQLYERALQQYGLQQQQRQMQLGGLESVGHMQEAQVGMLLHAATTMQSAGWHLMNSADRNEQIVGRQLMGWSKQLEGPMPLSQRKAIVQTYNKVAAQRGFAPLDDSDEGLQLADKQARTMQTIKQQQLDLAQRKTNDALVNSTTNEFQKWVQGRFQGNVKPTDLPIIQKQRQVFVNRLNNAGIQDADSMFPSVDEAYQTDRAKSLSALTGLREDEAALLLKKNANYDADHQLSVSVKQAQLARLQQAGQNGYKTTGQQASILRSLMVDTEKQIAALRPPKGKPWMKPDQATVDRITSLQQDHDNYAAALKGMTSGAPTAKTSTNTPVTIN